MKRREFVKLAGITTLSPTFLMGKGKSPETISGIAMPNGYEFVCIYCNGQKKGNTYWPLKGSEASEYYCFCGKKLTYIKNETDFDGPKRKYTYIPPNDETHPRPPMRFWGKEES